MTPYSNIKKIIYKIPKSKSEHKTTIQKLIFRQKTGRIIDMNDDGSLLFECDDGKIETVISADLEI